MTACLAAGLTAQQPRPVFRSGVAHVMLDVVVTDRDDRPVVNLTRDEFRIVEDGRPQAISEFELVSVPLENRTIDLRAAPAPAPDTASNAPPRRASRAVAFVLDDLTLTGQDIIPVQRIMAEFLRTLAADDLVAITYVRRSDLGQDFTSDTDRLIRAVTNLRASIGAPNSGVLRDTLLVLKNVASTLGAAPHARRAVVYVSSGYNNPLIARARVRQSASDAAFYAEIMEDAYRHARQRGIPIYAIDPRGLASPESVFGIGAIRSPGERAALASRIEAEQYFMTSLGAGTGGRGFVNQSDLAWAARQIVEENGSYYLLGFSPTPYRADDRFHDVKVTVTRPGLRVRARAGYLAERPRPLPTSAPTLRRALEDGVAGGDLALRACAAPVTPTRRGAGLALTVDIAYPARPDAAGDDTFHVAWVAVDPDARVRASGTRTLEVPLGSAAPFTLSLHDLIDVPRGTHLVRVAVVSRALGTMGTVHLPAIDVPQLAGRPLAMGGLVLGVEAAAGAPVRVARLDGAAAGAVPFPPTTRRTFAATERLHIFARVFAAAPAGVETALVLTLDGQPMRRVVPECAPAAGIPNALDCRTTLSLADLAAGEYALELTAAAGQERVSRAVAIAIEGG
jgi:VWFA-related protein